MICDVREQNVLFGILITRNVHVPFIHVIKIESLASFVGIINWL